MRTFESEDSAEDGSSLMALLPGEQGDAAPGESAPTTRTWYACPWYTPAGNMDHQDNYPPGN